MRRLTVFLILMLLVGCAEKRVFRVFPRDHCTDRDSKMKCIQGAATVK